MTADLLATARALCQPNAAADLMHQAIDRDDVELAQAVATRADNMLDQHPGSRAWAAVLDLWRSSTLHREPEQPA